MHKKVRIPKFQTAISPLLLVRFGRANMQIAQGGKGFPMEWEIPGSEQLFPKISNGHNSVVLRDNIVVFGLVFFRKTRAFHWKWNLPPRTSHSRDTNSGAKSCSEHRHVTYRWTWKGPLRTNGKGTIRIGKAVLEIWKIPTWSHRTAGIKISKRYISVISEPNMVMFILKMRRISRAIYW